MSGLLRRAWDRVSIYLPLMLMGLLALGSWWLVRSAPMALKPQPEVAARHEADYFMRNFSIKTFDAAGRRKSEIFGARAQHFPDTDTVEISQFRWLAFSEQGIKTTATAERALSNGDGSEIQLFGDAHVLREPTTPGAGNALPVSEFRSEFLHVFANTERMKTHKPVALIRGQDRFIADAMEYDNVRQTLSLRGHVRGEVQAKH